jgi:hypothetical protein
MTKLPEPDGYMPYPMCHIKRYTEAQMLQFRRDALEEAANEVESLPACLTWFEYAQEIRKLKDET